MFSLRLVIESTVLYLTSGQPAGLLVTEERHVGDRLHERTLSAVFIRWRLDLFHIGVDGFVPVQLLHAVGVNGGDSAIPVRYVPVEAF